jgi:threonine synthase
VAAGLRVPKPLGDFLILDAVRASGGTALAVSDGELLDAGIQLAREEGIFAAPEGGRVRGRAGENCWPGFLKPAERIVIYNTGAGLKYLEALRHAISAQTRRLDYTSMTISSGLF